MKLIFVTGKGGVGKTTFASAYALDQANKGNKVLLVEFGPKSHLKYIFNLGKNKEINYKRIKAPKNLEVQMWNFEEVLVEFITYYLKVKTLVKKFFSSPIMQKLIKVAPSLRELVYLGKATSGYRNIGKDMDYDSIVVDSYSTGHFLALMRSPVGMMEAVKRGAMHVQCKTILEVLKNPKQVEYFVVSLAEKLPIVETKEFVDILKKEFSISPKIVLNKVKQELDGKVDQACAFQKSYSKNTVNQKKNINKIKNYNTELVMPFVFKHDSTQIVKEMNDHLGDL